MKVAIIDIGSNSVRLMMSAGGRTLYKRIATTRLGEGVQLEPVLLETAMDRSALAVADFCRMAKEDGAEQVFAFATAAVRSARNGSEFCERIKRLSGLTVDVISGEDEALLGISGCLGNSDGSMIDIGGASTEVCVRQGGKLIFSVSMNIGAVRLFDACGQDRDRLENFIEEKLRAIDGVHAPALHGVGGTATTLGALYLALPVYDGNKVHGTNISAEEVMAWAEKLLPMTREERLALPGMEKGRADIIGGAVLLLARAMQKLGASEITVSDSDNQEGYLSYRGLV